MVRYQNIIEDVSFTVNTKAQLNLLIKTQIVMVGLWYEICINDCIGGGDYGNSSRDM